MIFVDVSATNRDQVISKLSETAKALDLVDSKEDFIQAVMQREEEFPTSIGFKVAIPHGKTKTVKEPFIGFCRTEQPFIWEQEGNKEVSLIFLIGVPQHLEGTLHLVILSQISRMLMNEDFRRKLSESKQKEDIYALLLDIENHIKEKNEN